VLPLRNRSASRLHKQLVELLEIEQIIRNPAVAAAFRTVPRHLFLPDVPLDQVYRDIAIPTKKIDGIAVSSSSQPALMAEMLQQLDVRPGHRVLEVGAGTGYNAALLAKLVGEQGHVITLDIDDDLIAAARKHLASAGASQVEAIRGDGPLGYAPGAPYDRIILTVGAWDIYTAWFEQLAPDGRLLLPLSLRGPQKSIAFVRENGHLRSTSVQDCGFVRLRGAFAGPDRVLRLGAEPGLYLSTEENTPFQLELLDGALRGGSYDVPTGIRVRIQDVWSGLQLWLALHDTRICGLRAVEQAAESGLVPDLMGTRQAEGYCFTIGLCGRRSIAVLAFSAQNTGELVARSFGEDASLGYRLAEYIAGWNAAGRPSTRDLTIRAYPPSVPFSVEEDEVVIPKNSCTLILTWRHVPPAKLPPE
jgi:protein-L-isoaspartate(D-aspartate) O-methyltransferase